VAVIFLLVFLFASSAQAALVATEKRCPDSRSLNINQATQKRAMSCLINHARQQKQMRKVKTYRSLTRAAKKKINAQINCGRVLSHTPCGSSFVNYYYRSGYLPTPRAWSVGENLAWGAGKSSSPVKIFRGWLNSPPHRKNIFNRRWRHQGLHVVEARFAGFTGAKVWASQFGYGGKR
jgi:uncharacterized protein YkwD